MESTLPDDGQYGDPGFYYRIPGGLFFGDVIEIQGNFIGKSILVELLANTGEEEDVNKSTPLQLVLNEDGSFVVSVIGEAGHKTQKSGRGTAPEGRKFHVKIIAFEDRYDIKLNSAQLCSHVHIEPLSDVTHLSITGEAEFTAVEFTDLQNENLESEQSSTHTLEDRSNVFPGQKGFIRLSQKRQSWNRRPEETVQVPLNPIPKEMQPPHRLSRTSEEESDTLSIKAVGNAGLKSMPYTAAGQMDSTTPQTSLFSIEGSVGQPDAVWSRAEGREINVDSGEVVTGGGNSNKSVTFPVGGANKQQSEERDKAQLKHKHGSLFGKHTKGAEKSKGEKKSRSSSSPPTVSGSPGKGEKKRKHPSLHLSRHKSKTDESKKSDPHREVKSKSLEVRADLQPTGVYLKGDASGDYSNFSKDSTPQAKLETPKTGRGKVGLHLMSPSRGSYNVISAEKIDATHMAPPSGLKGVERTQSVDLNMSGGQRRHSKSSTSSSSGHLKEAMKTSDEKKFQGEIHFDAGGQKKIHSAGSKSSSYSSVSSSESSFKGIKSESMGATSKQNLTANIHGEALVTSAEANIQHSKPPQPDQPRVAMGVTGSTAIKSPSTESKKLKGHMGLSTGKKAGHKVAKEDEKKKSKSLKSDKRAKTHVEGAHGTPKSVESKTKSKTKGRSREEKRSMKPRSQSEPAITAQEEKVKVGKRARIAEAFRRLFRRKKGKKSKSEADLGASATIPITGLARSSGSELSLNEYDLQQSYDTRISGGKIELGAKVPELETKAFVSLPSIPTEEITIAQETDISHAFAMPVAEKLPSLSRHTTSPSSSSDSSEARRKAVPVYKKSGSISESTTLSSSDEEDYNLSIKHMNKLEGNGHARHSSSENMDTKVEVSLHQNQFSAAPIQGFSSKSSSSSSSRSSISSSCQRVIVIGQSADYQERLASYRKRRALSDAGAKRDEHRKSGSNGLHKGKGSLSGSSTSSISSIESSALPPNLQKSKQKRSNGALLKSEPPNNRTEFKIVESKKQSVEKSEPYQPADKVSQPNGFEQEAKAAKLPSAKYGADFWNDIHEETSSSESETASRDSPIGGHSKDHRESRNPRGQPISKVGGPPGLIYDSSTTYSD